jgi:hypothetical protein
MCSNGVRNFIVSVKDGAIQRIVTLSLDGFQTGIALTSKYSLSANCVVIIGSTFINLQSSSTAILSGEAGIQSPRRSLSTM